MLLVAARRRASAAVEEEPQQQEVGLTQSGWAMEPVRVRRPVPPGWKRDFVLHSAGWDKDADLNTLAGQTIGPLPFRAMASYPPTIAMTRKQIEVGKLNAPHLLRHQSFRAFWSRQEVEDAQPRFLQAAE